jgi:hypothetical protein
MEKHTCEVIVGQVYRSHSVERRLRLEHLHDPCNLIQVCRCCETEIREIDDIFALNAPFQAPIQDPFWGREKYCRTIILLISRVKLIWIG